MNKFKDWFGFVFFGFFLVFVAVSNFIKSRQEYSNKYDFVIAKIRSNAKGYLTFYDSLRCEYSFASYKFTKWDKLGISVGDRVFKNSYSKDMTVSRRIDGVYKVYHVQEPNGMFSFSFYGDDNKELNQNLKMKEK